MECSRTRSGLDKASDRILHGLKLPRAKRRKCPAFFPSFFFSFGVEAVEGQRRGRGTKPQKTTARVVAVTDYAVPHDSPSAGWKGGGKEGGGKKERYGERIHSGVD